MPVREQDSRLSAGLLGTALVAALVLGSLGVGALSRLTGDSYHAAFAEAAGIKPGDEVRVAGIKVGQVDAVGLDGTQVGVDFTVTDDTVRLGAATRAAIKIETVVGRKFLALLPEGDGELANTGTIPLARTETPYEINQALSDLTSHSDQIDTGQLMRALETVSETGRGTPDEIAATLSGTSRLAQAIASRDEELRRLLERANDVSGVLADRHREVVSLFEQGNLLLDELEKRREVVHTLLVHTTEVSAQLTALTQEQRGQLEPALRQLGTVVDVLTRNQGNLEAALEMLVPRTMGGVESTGSGPFADVYPQNIPPLNLVPLPQLPLGGS